MFVDGVGVGYIGCCIIVGYYCSCVGNVVCVD